MSETTGGARLLQIATAAERLYRANAEPESPQGMLDCGCAFCRAPWSGAGPNEPPHEADCPWVELEALLGHGPNERLEKWRKEAGK